MNIVVLTEYSLSFAFNLLEQVVADLTQEQADWMPPGTANPIGALYWHVISYVDLLVHDWAIEQPPVMDRGDWKEKVVIASPPNDPDDPMGDLRAVREGLRVDLQALHDYAAATAQALLDWLASLTPEDLDRAIETTIGELTVGQMLQAYVVWHINVHCGEIAVLKGCQGLEGYPW